MGRDRFGELEEQVVLALLRLDGESYAVPVAAELGRLSIKIGEGVTGWVAEHRSVVALSSRASHDSRFKRFPVLVFTAQDEAEM